MNKLILITDNTDILKEEINKITKDYRINIILLSPDRKKEIFDNVIRVIHMCEMFHLKKFGFIEYEDYLKLLRDTDKSLFLVEILSSALVLKEVSKQLSDYISLPGYELYTVNINKNILNTPDYNPFK